MAYYAFLFSALITALMLWGNVGNKNFGLYTIPLTGLLCSHLLAPSSHDIISYYKLATDPQGLEIPYIIYFEITGQLLEPKPSIHLLQILSGITIIFTTWRVTGSLLPSILLSLLSIFFVLTTHNNIRQGLSVALIAISLFDFSKKKIIAPSLFILMSIFLHRSGIETVLFLVPIYFILLRFKFPYKGFLVSIATSLILYLALQYSSFLEEKFFEHHTGLVVDTDRIHYALRYFLTGLYLLISSALFLNSTSVDRGIKNLNTLRWMIFSCCVVIAMFDPQKIELANRIAFIIYSLDLIIIAWIWRNGSRKMLAPFIAMTVIAPNVAAMFIG